MGHTRSKTKRLFDSEVVAGSSAKTFDISDKKGVAIQLGITESCLCTSVFKDECVSLVCDTITETAHGYATGLKGTLSIQIGCAAATPSACISTACCLITEACHGFIAGERGRFTTSCTLPSFCCCVISACTDFFIISLSAGTYNVATTRANALACTGVCITAAGTGCQTFTPNGAIHTGLCTCASSSFIIKVDANTYKIASSKVNAEAGTAIDITALQSPATTTFTAACADCTSGTVTIRYSLCSSDSATYLVDACAGGILDTAGVILAAGLSVVDQSGNDINYNSIQVDVDITDSQWVVDIDISAKD